ncbi:DNA ligase [Ooceraea biroi]|nr:DNA ligase [Ooceraea biroi]
MADSADLVVLGAWYGTGNKGGVLSVFLMGCYDEERDKWLTVTKVHTGHDDATLAVLQDELDMVKIGKDAEKLPSWLHAIKPMIPDFVARDPKKQPVWEITGAEFTNQGVHTAEGISIRFPRVTRIRHDKDWSTATTLKELRALFKKKPESVDFGLLLGASANTEDVSNKRAINVSPKKFGNVKRETSPPNEPSTSFKVKEEKSPSKVKKEALDVQMTKKESRSPSGRFHKKRKNDEHDESSKNVTKEETLERKRLKTKHEIKQETETSTLARNKEEKSDTENSKQNRYIDHLDDSINAEEYLEFSTDFDSDVEDNRSSNVLQDVRASLAPDFDKSRRKDTRRMLRTLGATITENRFDSTHVIHTRAEIPTTVVLEEFADFPKTTKHVNVSWLEQTATLSRKQDEGWHAVRLVGDYCNCPCTHR